MLKRVFLRGLIHMYMYDQETSFKITVHPSSLSMSHIRLRGENICDPDKDFSHYILL